MASSAPSPFMSVWAILHPAGSYVLLEDILHVFMLTEADATQCSQRAGCQSSPGGGRILTAGEKGKQYTAVGIAIVNTEIANTRW